MAAAPTKEIVRIFEEGEEASTPQIRTSSMTQATDDNSADGVQDPKKELSTTRLVLILGGLWV
jgi:hypothetical protein